MKKLLPLLLLASAAGARDFSSYDIAKWKLSTSTDLAAETAAREAADATKVNNNNGTATNLTVNTYLNLGTKARFVVLTNGVSLQINAGGTNWVTQVEWTEE